MASKLVLSPSDSDPLALPWIHSSLRSPSQETPAPAYLLDFCRLHHPSSSILPLPLTVMPLTSWMHDYAISDHACKMKLRLWCYFLSSWNSIFFFYGNHITQPEDIQLYTDTAPTIGFGGYYIDGSAPICSQNCHHSLLPLLSMSCTQ